MLGDLHMNLDSKNHQIFVIDPKWIIWLYQQEPKGAVWHTVKLQNREFAEH